MKDENIEKYEAIHGDVLWYLLDVTKVNRFFTQNSLREFLVRYFLVTKHDLTQSATEFIDYGILISGTLETNYFEFRLQDLIHFIGFSKSDKKFNVDNFLDQFINDYQYKDLKVKYEYDENSNAYKVSTDTLWIMLMGLNNLLKIDSLTIDFKEDLKATTNEELIQVTNFVDYIINTIPLESYIDQMLEYKDNLGWMEEYYDSRKVIDFDPHKQLSRTTLIEIATICEGNSAKEYYFSQETMNEDLKGDFSIINEHIIFAYGVKHGHIRLSSDQSTSKAIHECYDPYFNINEEYINSDEGMVFTTQYIYDNSKMAEWQHLLP